MSWRHIPCIVLVACCDRLHTPDVTKCGTHDFHLQAYRHSRERKKRETQTLAPTNATNIDDVNHLPFDIQYAWLAVSTILCLLLYSHTHSYPPRDFRTAKRTKKDTERSYGCPCAVANLCANLRKAKPRNEEECERNAYRIIEKQIKERTKSIKYIQWHE